MVEFIIVISILGIVVAYATMRNSSPVLYTLSSQAQKLASDIRHVQSLATTWGKTLRITTTPGVNGTYSVGCVTIGAAPCNANPVINPATGAAYLIQIQKGVDLSGPMPLDIDSLGQPGVTAITPYSLAAGSATVTVTVSRLTGFVEVSP